MPQFCANLTMLFNEVEFTQRFAAAAQAGFTGVEYLFPYDFDKQLLAEQLGQHQLTQVLHNLPAGDWSAGERGIACHPDRVGEFQDGVGKAIEYASHLQCSMINCLAGIMPQSVSSGQATNTLIDNLRFAADALGKQGIKLLLEPINTFDIPGFCVTRSDQALAIINQVGSDNLYLQYDIYHAQRMEGELAMGIENNLARIAHLQLADNPGRNEPGTGEINYPWLFRHIDAIGYTGWIGCEYKPATTTTAGLGWLTTLA